MVFDMTDEVDVIAAAWQAERPDLELAPIQVLSRISRLAQLLDDRRSQAFAEHGLAAHEFDVLAALRRSGPPYEQTPGQLLEATHVTSGTMTNRLDRLAERHLIVRKSHPADGRQVIIRLTGTGRRRVDAAFEALLSSEEALLAGLPASQRASLAAGLRRLLTLATGPARNAPTGSGKAATTDPARNATASTSKAGSGKAATTDPARNATASTSKAGSGKAAATGSGRNVPAAG